MEERFEAANLFARCVKPTFYFEFKWNVSFRRHQASNDKPNRQLAGEVPAVSACGSSVEHKLNFLSPFEMLVENCV